MSVELVELIEAPCQACPEAMRKYCGQLLDRKVYAAMSEPEREKFGFNVTQAKFENLPAIKSCRDSNLNCPMSRGGYLDWVLSYHAPDGELEKFNQQIRNAKLSSPK